MAVHPRTSQLTDPDLPAAAALFDATQPPSPIRAAVAAAGSQIVDLRLTGVTWWPGRSATVTYRAELAGDGLVGVHTLVATTGAVPKGALVVGDGNDEVGVWVAPHDPVLTGMAAALDPVRVGALLTELGSPGPSVQLTRRAYRPTRRAVVSVGGRRHGLYLKVLEPSRAAGLHSAHRLLVDHLPVPDSLGVSDDLGIVALQSIGGTTLRKTLEDPSLSLPDPRSLVALSGQLPEPDQGRVAKSPVERVASVVELLTALHPEEAGRLQEIRERIGEDPDEPLVPVHGDFYEAQIMVEDGEVNGLLDVDTFAWGRPADDAATMIGHLDLWRHLSAHPERVRRYAADLLRIWEAELDPVDLRRRIAAVHLTLAPGSFRVQTSDWPAETKARIGMAEAWLESAESHEKDLIPASGTSYPDPAS